MQIVCGRVGFANIMLDLYANVQIYVNDQCYLLIAGSFVK